MYIQCYDNCSVILIRLLLRERYRSISCIRIEANQLNIYHSFGSNIFNSLGKNSGTRGKVKSDRVRGTRTCLKIFLEVK